MPTDILTPDILSDPGPETILRLRHRQREEAELAAFEQEQLATWQRMQPPQAAPAAQPGTATGLRPQDVGEVAQLVRDEANAPLAAAERRFGQDLPRLHPEAPTGFTPPTLEEHAVTRGTQLATGTARGVLGTAEGLLRFENLVEATVGIETPVGTLSRQSAEQLAQWRQQLTPDDPGLFDRFSESVGSVLTFFVPGIAAGKAASLIGQAAPRLAAWTGASTAALTEAASESGNAYTQLLTLFPPEEAARRANTIFAQQLVLLTLSNRFGVFQDRMPLLAKVPASMAFETGQELGQFEIEQEGLSVPLDHPKAEQLKAIGWVEQGERLRLPLTLKDAGEIALISSVLGGAGAVAESAHVPQNLGDAERLLHPDGPYFAESEAVRQEAEKQAPESAVRDSAGGLMRVFPLGQAGAVGRPQAAGETQASAQQPPVAATPPTQETQPGGETQAAEPPDREAGHPLPASKVVGPEGNLQRVFHGTPRAFEQFDTTKADAQGLYGPGVYFTENPEVAGGTGEKAPDASVPSLGYASGTGADMQTTVVGTFARRSEADAFAKQLQATEPGRYPLGVWKKDDNTGYEVLRFEDAGTERPNVRPAYLDIRTPFDIDGTTPYAEAAQLFGEQHVPLDASVEAVDNELIYDSLAIELGSKAAANEALQHAGFDGITHTGGGRVGDRSHRVWIAFRPEQIIPAFDLMQTLRERQARGQRGSIDFSKFFGTGETQAPPSLQEQLDTLVADAPTADASLSAGTRVLSQVRGQWLPGTVQRTVQTPEGQRAVVRFTRADGQRVTLRRTPEQLRVPEQQRLHDLLASQQPSVVDEALVHIQDISTEQIDELITHPPRVLEGRIAGINFDRIQSPDDVKTLINDIRQLTRVRGDALRRGTMSHEEIVQQARRNIREGRFTLETLLIREPGTAFRAEDIFAARLLTVGAVSELIQRSQTYDLDDPASQAAFRQSFAVVSELVNQLRGVTAEAGRALGAFIPDATGELQFLQQFQDQLQHAPTGLSEAELAGHLAQASSIEQVVHAVQKSQGGYWDMFLELLYAGKLLQFRSDIRNIWGNTEAILWTGMAHAYAAKGRWWLPLPGGRSGEVVPGEGAEFVYAWWRTLQDTFRLWRLMEGQHLAWNQGQVGLPRLSGAIEQLVADKGFPEIAERVKTEGLQGKPPAITAENLRGAGRVGRAAVGVMGEDLVNALGALARFGGAKLNVEDIISKVQNYQGFLHAAGLREATRRGLEGQELQAFLERYSAAAPAEVRERAKALAFENTLTEQLNPALQHGENLLNVHPAIRVVWLFYRTSVNSMRWSLRQTPLGILGKQYRDAVAQGGAELDIARAKMAMGTGLMALGVMAGLSGGISGRGPRDPERRRLMEKAGWAPYSFIHPLTGKALLNFDGTPLAFPLMVAGDIADMVRYNDIWSEDGVADTVGNIFGGGVLILAKDLFNPAFGKNVRDLLDAVSPPDYLDPDSAKKPVLELLEKQAAGLVPTAVADLRKVTDPAQREVYGLIDAMLDRLPGFSEMLEPERNPLGRHERWRDAWLVDIASPFYGGHTGSLVEQELGRLAASDAALRLPGTPRVIRGEGKTIRLRPAERERLNELLAGGFPDEESGTLGGLEQQLQALMQTDSYRLGTDVAKADQVRDLVLAYRKAGMAQFLAETPRLQERLGRARQERFRDLGLQISR